MVRRPTSSSQIETANSIPAPTPVEDVPTDPYAATTGTDSPPVVRTVLGTLPAPPDLTESERDAFEVMNDPLRAKVLEMRSAMNNELRNILESRYHLGEMVLEIHQHPEIYDHMSDIQMAQFFGDGGKTMYAEARRIRERYSPEEFQEILAFRNPKTGARVYYRHLTSLLAIDDKAAAAKTLDLCLSQNWTTRELDKYLFSHVKAGGNSRRSGGKRGTQPASFTGFLERMRCESDEDFDTYQRQYDRGAAVLKAFHALPDGKKTADLLKHVAKTRDSLLKAAEGKLNLAQECERLEQEIKSYLQQRRGESAQLSNSNTDGVEADGEPDEAHKGE